MGSRRKGSAPRRSRRKTSAGVIDPSQDTSRPAHCWFRDGDLPAMPSELYRGRVVRHMTDALPEAQRAPPPAKPVEVPLPLKAPSAKPASPPPRRPWGGRDVAALRANDRPEDDD